jgi:hypothetical protein
MDSLGSKFRSLSDSIKIRTASSGWPDNARDLRDHSAFISAKKFDLWVPSECVYELPDASFLCEYFRCVGRLLALQLLCWEMSESMGNHDSNVVGAGRVC